MFYESKKLRIAMFGHKRVPSREGGIEVVVEELSVRMAASGHDVTLYNRRGHHVSGAEFDEKVDSQYRGIKLKFVSTIDRKGLAAVTASLFASLYAAVGPYDVVHIHGEGPAFFCRIPKLFGKKVVVTIHGIDWKREKWKDGFGSKFICKGEQNAVRYADAIIVLSKNTQQYFKQAYGRKTMFLPNGVSRPQVVDVDGIVRQFGLKKNEYILFLGRLVPEKGLRCLLEAFRKVKTDKKLVIAGGASDTDAFAAALKRMAEADERILFTGFVQGRLLEELYSNAYVYVLPSDLEGMPLSLLEAMSYGNCCVVSNIAECTEVVEDHAVVFQKGDVDDLREKLQQCCNDPEMVSRYKAEATDFICRKYNWDTVTQKTLQLYYGKKR